MRLSQAGEVVGDWETHVMDSGVPGERVRVSRTTHLEEKGLRKDSEQQGHKQCMAPFSPMCWGSGPRSPALCPHGQQSQRLPLSNSLRGNCQVLVEDHRNRGSCSLN